MWSTIFFISVGTLPFWGIHLVREILRNWVGKRANNENFKGDSNWEITRELCISTPPPPSLLLQVSDNLAFILKQMDNT